jgi:hypothetical protein
MALAAPITRSARNELNGQNTTLCTKLTGMQGSHALRAFTGLNVRTVQLLGVQSPRDGRTFDRQTLTEKFVGFKLESI